MNILSSELEKLKSSQVLCVGDIILDEYIFGKTERLSPEAPVPILKKTKSEFRLGGVGNVFRNLISLKAKPSLMAICGNDERGKIVSQLLCPHIDNDAVDLIESDAFYLALKQRLISQNQQILRIDDESDEQMVLSEAVIDRFKKRFAKKLEDCDVIIVSDYDKGFAKTPLFSFVIDKAREKHKQIFIDSKSNNYSYFEGIDLLTPNKKEFFQAIQKNLSTIDEIVIYARKCIDIFNIKAFLVTLSEEGMVYIDKNTSYHIPAEEQEVFDVTGAGDTVVAIMAAARAVKISVDQSMRIASKAAAIKIKKMGTQPVYYGELLESCLNEETVGHSQKVVTKEQALEIVTQWKEAGYNVGFTNGCFDIIHPGHLSLIANARSHCDKLILAINSDESIRKLKGPNRPIQDQETRMRVLSSLADVDLVILFSEETPMKLINHLHPDCLFKGSDYKKDEVVGAKFVESYGGSVILIDHLEGFSTTSSVMKIQNAV